MQFHDKFNEFSIDANTKTQFLKKFSQNVGNLEIVAKNYIITLQHILLIVNLLLNNTFYSNSNFNFAHFATDLKTIYSV